MSYNSPFSGDVIQPTDVSYRAITLSADTYLSWPINGSATNDYAARVMEITPTTSGLSLYMPPANQASVGQDALIRNMTGITFTVKDASGGTIVSVTSGKSEYIYITANGTVAGTWGIIGFGTGTSSADAATLAGSGLFASSLTLNQNHVVSALSPNYTVQTSDLAKALVWQGGAGTLNLPTSVDLGANWFTLLKNDGTGTLAVSCYGAQLIDGTNVKNFQPNESAFIVCTGTGFFTVGYGVSNNFNFTALVKPVTTGSYTLTANEAASTIQEYVGSLTGDVTVTYPPVVNLYVVSNQVTANGHTLTITTGAGAPAIIPAGQQATLVCDGTNFFNANTVQAGATTLTLTDGSVSAPSLSFVSETNTGLYRVGTGQLGIAVLGANVVSVTSSGIAVNGTGTFTVGITGGVFS
jgi:hypothetical protein